MQRPHYRSSTRHRLIAAGIALVLGVITTVGLAWACAAWVDLANGPVTLTTVRLPVAPTDSPGGTVSTIGPVSITVQDDDPQSTFLHRSVRRRFGHSRIDILPGTFFIGSDGGMVIGGEMPGDIAEADANAPVDVSPKSEDRAGWPFRALRSVNTAIVTLESSGFKMSISNPGGGIANGIELSPIATGASRWRALPLQPMWTGLLADVLIFSVAWYGVLFAPWMVRRARRRRRGQCLACGYDLRGELPSGCPECGWQRDAPVADEPSTGETP